MRTNYIPVMYPEDDSIVDNALVARYECDVSFGRGSFTDGFYMGVKYRKRLTPVFVGNFLRHYGIELYDDGPVFPEKVLDYVEIILRHPRTIQYYSLHQMFKRPGFERKFYNYSIRYDHIIMEKNSRKRFTPKFLNAFLKQYGLRVK